MHNSLFSYALRASYDSCHIFGELPPIFLTLAWSNRLPVAPSRYYINLHSLLLDSFKASAARLALNFSSTLMILFSHNWLLSASPCQISVIHTLIFHTLFGSTGRVVSPFFKSVLLLFFLSILLYPNAFGFLRYWTLDN